MGIRMTKRATMIDIAERAGVSQATVSLVLSGVANARISEETRARVRMVAEQMGYVRKSSLVHTGETRVIGLLIDEVEATPFATQFIEGARLEAASQGALVAVFCTGADPEVEAAALQVLSRTSLAGVLYTSLVTRNVTPPQTLGTIPTVLLNCHMPGGAQTSVVPADVTGAFAATQTLIRVGHRRIAHISGETWGEAARDRALGYRRALASHDIAFAPELLAGPAWTAISGREIAHHLMDLPQPPTAIFCFNDRVALGCYEAMAERALNIPRDISIIGFDNDNIAATLQPPLTTMILPHEEMARWAVAELLSRAAQGRLGDPIRVKIDCELVERASVAPPSR
jgi:LacI family transcriptional regulator